MGGFNNGIKMNDLYKLEIGEGGQSVQWEQIVVETEVPEPRAGFHGACFIDENGGEQLLIFGGTNTENDKMNDLWLFNGK